MFKEATEVYSDVAKSGHSYGSMFLVPNSCKPFLKWAGGKSQLIPTLKKFIPNNFNKYLEPFIGGGALFFQLNHSQAVISDLNEELIITYKAVRDSVVELIRELRTYINDESSFYRIRALNTNELTEIQRAARIIFLNKTCFNGLYRVNKKGQFNVPYNKSVGSNFLNEDGLLNCSMSLQGVEVEYCDYKITLNRFADKNDFVFLDPPYQPVGKYADFKRYTKERFHEKDHEDLFLEFKKLVDRGCHVILTNSNHPLILDLFKDFQIEIVDTKRLISSDSATRTGKDIIIIGGA